MKCIAMANMKGGVAKTTTTITLAETLASEEHKKVVVIDLDNQANATSCLVGTKYAESLKNQGKTIDQYFAALNSVAINQSLWKYCKLETSNIDFSANYSDGRVSLVPASSRLHSIERQVLERKLEKYKTFSAYREVLAEIVRKDLKDFEREGYDFIIFDMPPGISIFAEVFLSLSDIVIIPAIPDHLSLSGIKDFKDLLKYNKILSYEDIGEKTFILPTKYQDDFSVHAHMLGQLAVNAKNADDNGQMKYFKTIENGSFERNAEGVFIPFKIKQSNIIAEATQDAMNEGMDSPVSFDVKYGSACENLRAFSSYFIHPTYLD